jgi:hypothetical protein
MQGAKGKACPTPAGGQNAREGKGNSFVKSFDLISSFWMLRNKIAPCPLHFALWLLW